MWRVGCLGAFIFGREVVRVMLQRGRGTIIFTGASASLRGKATFAAFAAAKAGLRVVSQSFAREFGPSGIHVVHVIVDGSIDGDKIFSVVPDIAQRKGPDGLIRPGGYRRRVLVSAYSTSLSLVAGNRFTSL
jgi:NAD(P)-dependent dehydrogenase (short-subunit alcohol dehydrogenase family)